MPFHPLLVRISELCHAIIAEAACVQSAVDAWAAEQFVLIRNCKDLEADFIHGGCGSSVGGGNVEELMKEGLSQCPHVSSCLALQAVIQLAAV